MADRDTDELNIDNVIKKLLKGKDQKLLQSDILQCKSVFCDISFEYPMM